VLLSVVLSVVLRGWAHSNLSVRIGLVELGGTSSW